MLLKLDDAKILKEVINIICELVTEVRIKVNEEGLSIVAIDPANVALVSFKLPKKIFSQFEIEEEEIIGISLDNFKAILRRYKGGSIILKTEENTLVIEIQEKIKRSFSLALINIEEEEKNVPKLDFKIKIEMDSEDFNEAIEDCAVVSESCSFIAEKNRFVIEAKGLHSSKAEFSSDFVKIDGEGKAKYSVEYLQKFIKACKLVDKIIINFSTDYPLQLIFSQENFELLFILAPRVDTEE